MDRRVMGFGGSVLLLLGAFLPAVSVPMLGSISYFDNGKGDGIFILLLALASFILAARNRDRFLLYTGSAAAALVLAGMIYLMFMIERLKKELATDASTCGWCVRWGVHEHDPVAVGLGIAPPWRATRNQRGS